MRHISYHLMLLFWMVFTPCRAATYVVTSASDLGRLMPNLQPGDICVLRDGTYIDQRFRIGASGTKEKPFVFKAETSGMVRLTGSSRLRISGRHVHIEGFVFENGSLNGGSVIALRDRSSKGGFVYAQDCVVRQCAIINYNPPLAATRYHWLSLYGSRHVVEHCYFSGQSHSGVTLCVWLDAAHPAEHRIQYNRFHQRRRGTRNGFETIRIGTSANSHLDARCIVASNVFADCNGEMEIISNKSGHNHYLGNFFHRCQGTLTLRHGNQALVQDNIFNGSGDPNTGGIRITGRGHRIVGNHFINVGQRGGGVVSLLAAMHDAPAAGYQQVQHLTVADNSFHHNQAVLYAFATGFHPERRSVLPQRVHIEQNFIISTQPPMTFVQAHADLGQQHITWKRQVVKADQRVTKQPFAEWFVPVQSDAAVRSNAGLSFTEWHVGPTWMPRWQLPKSVD